MIKINKQNPPAILEANKITWTKALKDAVVAHKGYDKIPIEEKKKLLAHYKHKDIQESLFASSFSKCAYCECKPAESGNIEVEHYAPKSIYPELTFDWNNLLPVCRKCNGAKLDFDTVAEPIINPADIDPETIITYEWLRITPKQSPQQNSVELTINICNLNSSRLYEVRASLLKALIEYEDELGDKIQLIETAETDRKKKMRTNKLNNSIEQFEQTMQSNSCYAGYCRWFASNSSIYAKAKAILGC